MSSKLHSISTSCNLNFTASQSHTPSTSRRFMFSCNSVSLCAVKMLHQGAAGAFSWSICCSQWLNHCVKVISISVVFFTLMLWCFSSHGSFSLSWTASRWLRLKCTLVLCFFAISWWLCTMELLRWRGLECMRVLSCYFGQLYETLHSGHVASRCIFRGRSYVQCNTLFVRVNVFRSLVDGSVSCAAVAVGVFSWSNWVRSRRTNASWRWFLSLCWGRSGGVEARRRDRRAERLSLQYCRLKTWFPKTQRMKIEQFKSSQKGNLTQNQFFKPKHEFYGIFEASVLSGSGIPPIPHYPHSLHGSNGWGFGGLEN